ncbi:MAG TPA: hypothetical protein PK668_10655 [Myxococcota bacterium]|nr:hypothetical protein [Myxococcota bacterium]HRY93377.1 hypothetical protein [Myxococcota bacterium]HSA23043.1 hypothetical protein [Myxococcota bacterium]
MQLFQRFLGLALVGLLGTGCAAFDGKIAPIEVYDFMIEEHPVQKAVVTVFFEKPEVVDNDEEKDFTPIADAFALSLRQRLSEYLCARRQVMDRCIDRPAEGAYRMTSKVVMRDYRAAHGGALMFIFGSLLLPPLLGVAWAFPVALGSCDWSLELALYAPSGEELWKKSMIPSDGSWSCSEGADIAVRLNEELEEVISELSQTASTYEEVAARARAAEARKLAAAPAPAPGKAFIIAVFTLEDRGAKLGEDVQERLSEYLASAIAASGRYQVIPRVQLKERLGLQKTESYKVCYDQNCQIELGKELAAEKSLSTQVIKLGARCMVTAVIFDLKTAASEGGASQEGGCGEDELAESMKEVVGKLTQAR